MLLRSHQVLPSALLLIFLTSACYRPCGFYRELDLVTVNPEAELVGRYRPTEETLRTLDIPEVPDGRLGLIQLHPNGRVAYVNMPSVPQAGLGRKRGTLINTAGTWHAAFDDISHTGTYRLWVAQAQTPQDDIGSWRVYRRQGRLVLFRFIGDPDECSCLQYEKQ
jgi:hypothetical protein